MPCSRKQAKKKYDKSCVICGEAEYCALHVHRIAEGQAYGDLWNCITVCGSCHLKIHGEIIKIVGKYKSTCAKGWVLVYLDEEGKEHII